MDNVHGLFFKARGGRHVSLNALKPIFRYGRLFRMNGFLKTFACALFLFAAAELQAKADDFGMEIRAFPERMGETFRKLGDRTRIAQQGCLPGDTTKRTVCTYKLGDYMLAMAAGAVGSDKLSDLTLICVGRTDLDGLRCLTGYGAAIATMVPEVDLDDRGKIIKALFTGVEAGDAAQITKDNRRYILQHVAGALWFHIELVE